MIRRDETSDVSLLGEQIKHRHALYERFSERLAVDDRLTRSLVSYQGNRNVPGFRWLKYKEGFSLGLIERFLSETRPTEVLDPFAGIGTTPLAAVWGGFSGTGIEIMPIGVRAGQGIAYASNGVSEATLCREADRLLAAISTNTKADPQHYFPHVAITERAFSDETEDQIARARQYLSGMKATSTQLLLDLACMTVLEAASFTRKDGQYLRWDYRSGRRLRSRFDIGTIESFPTALQTRIAEMIRDISILKARRNGGSPSLLMGSCLELLRDQPDEKFDLVITSPPYANRYDYTRTYALELAWLGLAQADFARLRQSLLTATVENKSKRAWLRDVYADDLQRLAQIQNAYEDQDALHEVLSNLESRADELSNRHVIRLVEGYFFEMGIVIAELARIVRPGGTVIMVNDNVQYHGEEVPVDLILSDIAERWGFVCTNIWMLPRGKGNSSQQMAKFGRREIRKCVYRWERSGDND